MPAIGIFKLARFIETYLRKSEPLYLKITRTQEHRMSSDSEYKNTLLTRFRRDGCKQLSLRFNSCRVEFPESLSGEDLDACVMALINRRDHFHYPIEGSVIDLTALQIPTKK